MQFIHDLEEVMVFLHHLDKMSLIDEYGQDKEKLGISIGMPIGTYIEQERIITNLLHSGMNAETITKTAKIPLSKVKAIEQKIKNKK